MLKITNPKELFKYFDIPAEAVEFLMSADMETECKKYFFGENCFINVQVVETKTETLGMEAHTRNVDIQYLIDGEEKIYYKEKDGLNVVKSCPEGGDTAIYAFAKDAKAITYKSGEAIVLYPEEAHSPNKAVSEPAVIKKAVVKIKSICAK